jgi:hypothetical protein
MTDDTTPRLLDEVAPRDLSDDKIAFHGDQAETFAALLDRLHAEHDAAHKAEIDEFFAGATARDKPKW